MRVIRLICLVLVVTSSIGIAAAQTRKVVVRVLDGGSRPVRGVRLRQRSNGILSAPSDQKGITWINVSAEVKPGQSIGIEIVGSGPQKWILVSPSDDNITVRSFDSSEESVTPIVVINRNDPNILISGRVLYASASRMVRQLKPEEAARFLSSRQRQAVLEAEARRLGVRPSDLSKALTLWAEKAKDPYEKGIAYLYQERFPEASELLRKSFDLRSGETFDVARNLGFSLFNEGYYAEAAAKYQVSLDIRPNDANVANDLGMLFIYLARYDDAADLLNRSLKLIKSDQSADDEDVARTLGNQAWLFRIRQNFQAAKEADDEAFRILSRKFGRQDWRLYEAYNNYGALYHDQRDFVSAKQAYQNALDLLKPNRNSTYDYAFVLTNLAASERDNGELVAAQEHFETSLRTFNELVRKRLVRANHPVFAWVQNEYSGVFDKLQQFNESERRILAAKEIYEETFGDAHPLVATLLNNLGALYLNTNRSALGKSLFEAARDIRIRAVGHEHPDVAGAISNLANYYLLVGDFSTAEKLFLEARDIYDKYRNQDSELAGTYNNLGSVYGKQRRLDFAETNLKKAKELWEKGAASQKPLAYSATLVNLGDLYRIEKRFAEAQPLLAKGLEVREQIVGVQKSALVEVLGPYGGMFFVQAKYAEAQPLWERAVTLSDQPGTASVLLAQSLNNLGELYRRMGKLNEAEKPLKRAYEMWPKVNLGESDRMLLTCEHYAALLTQLGRDTEAKEIEQHADRVRKKLSERH